MHSIKNIIEAVPDPVIVLDKNLRVKIANESFYSQFKILPEQTEGELLYDLGQHQWDIPQLRQMLEAVWTQKTSVDAFELCHEFPGIGERTLLLNARIIDETPAREQMVLVDFKDITEKKKAEDKISRLASFPEMNPNPIYEIDFNGTVVYANPAAQKLKADGLAFPAENNIKELIEDFHQNREKEIVHEVQVGERWYLQSVYRVPSAEILRAYYVDITKRKQAQVVLDFQWMFLEAIFEHIDAGVVACNEKGERVLFNRKARDWYGVGPMKIPQTEWANAYGLFLEDGTTPMDISTIPLARAFRGEVVQNIPMVIAPKGQPKRYILANAGPVKDNNGRVLGAVCIMHDITERKQAEEALIRENSFRSAIIENQPGMVWFKDKEGKFLAVNQQFAHGCGHENSADVIGKTDFDIWPKELAGKYRADDEEVMRTKQSLRVEELIEDRGVRKFYETFKTPVVDASGCVLGTSGFAQDITERRQMEDGIREAQHFNEEVILAAGEGIIVYDDQLCYKVWNPTMERLTGIPAAEVLGKKATDLFPHLVEQGVDQLLARAMFGQTVVSQDMVYRVPKTGKIGWSQGIYTPHRDNKGKIIGVIGMVRDITERKLMEEELKIAKEQAEAANRYKTEFLRNISHDLRTPLNAILGFSQMLKSVPMEDKHRKGVDFINERGAYLLAMIEDILNASRIDSGKVELKSQELDLHKLLEDSMELSRVALGQKDVTMSLSCDGPMPRLKGDVFRVRQIIDNVLSNASKYTSQGQITLTAGVEDHQSNKNQYRVRVSVKDTGIGIPENKLPFIFDPFTRAHEFGKGQTYDGLGLGLHIAKKLAVLMGGDIRVLSQVNKGSEFIVTFNCDKIAEKF